MASQVIGQVFGQVFGQIFGSIRPVTRRAAERRMAPARDAARGWSTVGRLGAAALALTATSAPEPATAQLRIVTNTGIALDLPAIESLSGDCGRIEQVLHQIDRSNYRTGSSSFHPSDRPLFEYENRVSWLRVQHCDLGNPQKFRRGIGSFTGE